MTRHINTSTSCKVRQGTGRTGQKLWTFFQTETLCLRIPDSVAYPTGDGDPALNLSFVLGYLLLHKRRKLIYNPTGMVFTGNGTGYYRYYPLVVLRLTSITRDQIKGIYLRQTYI